MYKLFKNNKKAQTGDTITWLVATIVILVVLLIAIFISSASVSSKKAVSLEDKHKDLIATKSIESFLQNPKNKQLLDNKDYAGLEAEVRNLLEILLKPSVGSAGDWNFELYEGEEKKIEVINYHIVGNVGKSLTGLQKYNHLEIIFLSGETKLRFWLECQGAKCTY